MKLLCIYFVLFVVILSCNKEDGHNDDLFFAGSDTDVVKEDIEGTWAIFAVEFEDEYVEVAPDFYECGRDYLVFDKDGRYIDFVFDKIDCTPQVSNANWKLEAGVIVLSDSSGESEKIPVLDASQDEIVLKYRFDLNNDGTLDTFKAFLRPYDPIANNYIANSFKRDLEQPTLLQFNWKLFPESEDFGRYEIYRAPEGDCSKENAQLVATVDEISTISFVDYDPPETQENICYFLKVFSKNGLVGESELLSEDPKEIIIDQGLILDSPNVQNNNVQLSWTSVDIPYFSHYEIIFANKENQYSASYEYGEVAIITDQNQTTYLDENPPFIENPYYAIYTVNRFGTRTLSNFQNVTYRRKDLFTPFFQNSIINDNSEPAIYFYGYDDSPNSPPDAIENRQLIRYNYSNKEIEANFQYDYTSWDFHTPINEVTSSEGKELILLDFYGIYILDPESFSEKFFIESSTLFEQFDISVLKGFDFLDESYWVAFDSFDFYVLKRNGANLELIDKYTFDGFRPNEMIVLNENNVLVGQYPEESVLLTINENGEISDNRIVSALVKNSLYNPLTDLFINKDDKTIYSTDTFEPIETLPEDIFPVGISSNGVDIYCTFNDPELYGRDFYTETLQKQLIKYESTTKTVSAIVETKGYPIEVFNNGLGEVISISIPDNTNPLFSDIFIENIEHP